MGGKGALPKLVKPLFYMKVFTGLHQLIDTVPSGTLLSDRLKRIKWSAALLKPRWEGLAKGRVFLARKPVRLSSEDLQQIRLIALVGFTVLPGLRSDNWKV